MDHLPRYWTGPSLLNFKHLAGTTCYIITEWLFLYKSFFVNYILSFSLVGLWTIRLLVQVHRHWVQFTLVRRGYDNHNCHNKPQRGNETGVWMTSSSEAMGWEFGYFEKHVSWVLTVGQSSWLSNGDQSSWESTWRISRVEVDLRPWRWEVEVWPWSSADLYRERS